MGEDFLQLFLIPIDSLVHSPRSSSCLRFVPCVLRFGSDKARGGVEAFGKVIPGFDSSSGRGRLLGVGGESRGLADEVLRDFTRGVTGGEQGGSERERSEARSIF
jgi:hypothetical protein